MKIRSFGCSFLAGDELEDPSQTWPAIIAETLGIEHLNHAEGAAGNFRILHNILGWAQPSDLCFVNWTYVDRYDYRCWQNDSYATLLPGDNDQLSQFYFKNLYGQYHQTFCTLICVKIAIDFLQHIDAKFIMTFMDDLIFAAVDNNWENPIPTNYLQTQIKPYARTWKGKNFLDWAKTNKFPVSQQNHPLDQAHKEAAKFFGPLAEWLLEGLPATSCGSPFTWQNWRSKHWKDFPKSSYK